MIKKSGAIIGFTFLGFITLACSIFLYHESQHSTGDSLTKEAIHAETSPELKKVEENSDVLITRTFTPTGKPAHKVIFEAKGKEESFDYKKSKLDLTPKPSKTIYFMNGEGIELDTGQINR